MKISKLKPNAKNPRTISDEKLASLKKALLKFGDLSGVVYNKKSSQLVCGHQRVKSVDDDADITLTKKYSKPTKTGTVAEGYFISNGDKFSYREVWWDDPTEKAANIAANKGAGSWDLPQLGEWLKELSEFDLNFDLDLTMFDEDERKEFGLTTVEEHTRKGATGVDEDEVPEVVPPRSKLGDIYLLGEHRLMCGDSTKESSVARLMKGQKADMVLTDPPYNQETDGGPNGPIGSALRKQSRSIEHMCDFDPENFLRVLPKLFKLGTLNAFIFTSKDLVVDYLNWAKINGFSYNILVWKKPNAIPIGGSYRPDIEYLLTFRKSGVFNAGVADISYSKVLEFSREKEKIHPTMKPVGLLENQIRIGSNLLVVDLFGGSGSTLIACEKTHRKCFMMEIDPHYCDVIVERWEKYTGLKAKRVRTETKLVKQAPKHAHQEA